MTSDLKLLPSAGSDRAWVWNPQADYADEEPKPEQLAIRFANAESEYAIIMCVDETKTVLMLYYYLVKCYIATCYSVSCQLVDIGSHSQFYK